MILIHNLSGTPVPDSVHVGNFGVFEDPAWFVLDHRQDHSLPSLPMCSYGLKIPKFIGQLQAWIRSEKIWFLPSQLSTHPGKWEFRECSQWNPSSGDTVGKVSSFCIFKLKLSLSSGKKKPSSHIIGCGIIMAWNAFKILPPAF